MGRRFLSLLSAKAREGVEVRLLVDDVGTSLPTEWINELREAGGKFARFSPSLIPFIPVLNFNINFRNHRKIVVIDGKIGYLGGFNIGSEYCGMNPKLGFWRDSHLRIEGCAALSMQMRFILDWR